MVNAYLDGIKLKAAGGSKKTLLLWVLLVAMFLGIWQFLSPSPDPASRIEHRSSRHAVACDDEPASAPPPESPWEKALPVLAMCIAFPLLVTFFVRRQIRHAEGTRSAEAMLLEDDIDGAVAKSRTMLKKAAAGLPRFQALMILGRCAEQRGDFVEAAEIYARATTSFPNVIGAGLLKNQVLPIANARCAFVLAAANRLDEAEALLAAPQAREALPGTHALMVRARVIVDSKRGRYRQLLDGLTSARAVLRESLPLREQILLRVVAAHARIAVADVHRAAQPPPPAADPALAAWIARVVPSARAILEGAS